MDIPQGAFWSGETLGQRLPSLIEPYSPDRIDCAAYTLAIGPEVYVSPSDQAIDSTSVTVRKLSDTEAFTVPPGQFAFLISEESVTVPDDALAFISIRARTKFRGLVNVSGFHVDPGFHGQLTFAVFNAGPVPIHLKRGQPVFLIWYANLDRRTTHKKSHPPLIGLDSDLISGISGELQSFASLAKKIKDVDKSLGDRINSIEKQQAIVRVVAGIVLSILVGLAGNWLKDNWPAKSSQPPVAATPFPTGRQ